MFVRSLAYCECLFNNYTRGQSKHCPSTKVCSPPPPAPPDSSSGPRVVARGPAAPAACRSPSARPPPLALDRRLEERQFQIGRSDYSYTAVPAPPTLSALPRGHCHIPPPDNPPRVRGCAAPFVHWWGWVSAGFGAQRRKKFQGCYPKMVAPRNPIPPVYTGAVSPVHLGQPAGAQHILYLTNIIPQSLVR